MKIRELFACVLYEPPERTIKHTNLKLLYEQKECLVKSVESRNEHKEEPRHM